VFVGLLYQYSIGFDGDRTLFYLAIIFAVIHLVVFGRKLGRPDAAD